MAVKKETLREMYERALGNGSLDRCDVLSFTFPSEGSAHSFHYALLSDKGLTVGLFDCVGERVNVVLYKGDGVGRVRVLAESLGGVEKKIRI